MFDCLKLIGLTFIHFTGNYFLTFLNIMHAITFCNIIFVVWSTLIHMFVGYVRPKQND